MEEQGFLAITLMVEGGEGLPFLERVPVLRAVELGVTLGEYHHLTHNGHVQFIPAQLCSIASNPCVVLR